MADIFKLVGSIFVDTDKANDSLQKTDKKAKSVGDTFGKIAGGAAKVGTAVVGMATTAVSGVVALASETASAMDVIDKASIRMGISAESYQELSHAAGLCGVEMSTMEKAAKKLEGTDLNLDDALDQIMSLKTAEERTAKASELFGESIAYNLEPLLQSGGDAFAAMKQEANDLGLVMSQETVSAGAQLNDTINNIKDSFSAVGTQLGGALLPLVQEFAEDVLDFMPMIQNMMKDLAPVIQDLFIQLLPPLMDLAKQLMPLVINLAKDLMPILAKLFDAIAPIVIQLIEGLEPILTALMPIITIVANLLVDSLGKAFQFLEPIIDICIDLITGLLNFVTDVFEKGWEEAWTNIVEVFKKIWNKVPEVVENVINGAIKMINGLIGGINKIGGKIGIKEIKLIEEVSLPKMEKGGILEKGQMGFLEGNGAEAVVPLEKNSAWISAVAKDMDASMGGGRVEELLQNLIDKVDSLSISEVVQIIPDEEGLFKIIRDQSRINKRRGGASIVV